MLQEIDKRNTKALIFTDNLRFNFRNIKNHLKAGTTVCAAVKADGYGHGAVEVSQILLEAGAETLGVSAVCEGGELRDAGISAPILLFGHASLNELEGLCRWQLEPFAGDLAYLQQLENEARRQNMILHVHLKIDTGMGRIGCPPEEAPILARYIIDSPDLHLAGTCTHFPVSDSPEKEHREFTARQIRIFKESITVLQEAGLDPGKVHAANSGAIANWPEAHFDMVRPGIILYGYYPDPGMNKPFPLKPVMQFETVLSFVKKMAPGKTVSYGRTWTSREETLIGTMAVGYADGYCRLLSNQAEVMIGRKRFPLAGRICMDQTMVDLGPGEEGFKPGDRVILFGPEESAPGADELGIITGTIPYEVTCAVSRRVPRVYI